MFSISGIRTHQPLGNMTGSTLDRAVNQLLQPVRLSSRAVLALKTLFLPIALLTLFFAIQGLALAAGGTGGLPWEKPIELTGKSLAGPVAFYGGVIGFVIAGLILVFGNDLSDFARRVILIVLALSLVFLATGFISTLYGVSGATL